MKTFLEEVAKEIYRDNPRLEEVTVVFPNRRASLFFRKHLSKLIKKPVFAPRIVTIEDFFNQFSDLRIPDKLVLISMLFQSYTKVMDSSPEDADSEKITRLEDFYFWGDMLLRDFDEVDKYMVSAEQLFKDLSHQKELDSGFDFLTEEQREFLKNFWSHFDVNQSVNKRRFLRMWRRLSQVYAQFKADLRSRCFAFEGMLHRSVAEGLVTGQLGGKAKGVVVFAGFNALTTAEEKMITFFVGQFGAKIYWDTDAYYVNNKIQEAGLFFREYEEKPVLGKTFGRVPAHFQTKISSQAEVHLYGAAQPVGQAKVMAQVLQAAIAEGMDPEETLVVLPDEKLLMPVLHGISGSIEKLNVTMGFPLASTPLFNFVELILDLHISSKGGYFNHRQVLGILGHPYVVAADPVSASTKGKDILKHNWVHIPKSYLATEVPLHRMIFQEVRNSFGSFATSLIRYLQDIIREIGGLKAIGDLDKEYALHFSKFFNVLESVLKEGAVAPSEDKEDNNDNAAVVRNTRSFARLFRQLVRMQRIPFRGEPLRGLQIMGVLETRNLDFKNVFILSLNEGAFPSTGMKGSYIPHNIRKAYGLPTLAHHDAMYAYLFYRTLQRAENIFLFYNSETDVLGQGEMSRYLQQLLFESGLNIRRHVLHNTIQPHGISPISVSKNAEVMANLIRLNEGNAYFKGISPSALNSYIECRLQFYFRHVAKIREPNEVEEELDARVLGNFLHDVMENFYKDLGVRKGSKLVEKKDFQHADGVIDKLIDQVFISTYRLEPDRPVEYAGQRLVVREIVKRFAEQIIRMDEAYAPFTIEALEQEGLTYPVKIGHPPYEVIVGGKIDRVDSKDDLLRIIDYKTGKDKLDFDSIDSLFARDGKRNKAAFQTLLYALMYVNSVPIRAAVSASKGNGMHGRQRIVPGLINRMNVFDEGFEFGLRVGKQQVNDVMGMFPEFEKKLKELFEELYDPDKPFDQTAHTDVCKYCPYSQICYR